MFIGMYVGLALWVLLVVTAQVTLKVFETLDVPLLALALPFFLAVGIVVGAPFTYFWG